MDKSGADARMQYLESTAQLLTASSPAASAYIQSIRNTGLDGKSPRNTGATRICLSCGSSLIPGWSCKKRTRKPTSRTPKAGLQSNEKTTLKLECFGCNSTNEFMVPETRRYAVQKSSNIVRPIPAAPPSTTKSTNTPAPPAMTPVTSSVSEDAATKKRGRNKKSSLQSLLAGQMPSRPGASKPAGLDIMDFMKK